MHPKDRTGLVGENKAESHLAQLGHKILQRRWRCSLGELDLITQEDNVLVGVEVKTRRGLRYGHPLESVTVTKLKRLHRLISVYAAESGLRYTKRRVDMVAVVLEPAMFGDEVAALEHREDVRL